MKPTRTSITRREFVGGALTAAGVVAGAPAILRGQNLNNKLNLAIIGAGGRGAANLKGVASENIVALCDVSRTALDAAKAAHPNARTFTDFRKVFDQPSDFDAVVVSTCEHTHAFATMLALNARTSTSIARSRSTHNIWEARLIREAAARSRRSRRRWASRSTPPTTIAAWSSSSRAARSARCARRTSGCRAPGACRARKRPTRNKDIVFVTDRPTEAAEVPPDLDWDLWLGPAPERPFHPVYVPGPKWYRWWDFGSGTMSDLGSHWNDLPFWALRLKAPLTIEATGGPGTPEIAPRR